MESRAVLRLVVDPSAILSEQGIMPDPWQRQLLRSPPRQVLLNCSRQSGKSTTVAALALHTALFQPGSLTLLLSPSLRQSIELFRKVGAGFTALGRPVRTVQASQTRLELANRSRIVCLPGREDTVRSFSGVALLVIDEAARVPDDLYRSVRPMLAVSRGRLICLSTPFGRRGFFWREWHAGGAAWHRVEVGWRDCPRITADFIEQERQSMGSSWVAQEYEASFESREGLVYPDFGRCAVATAPAGLRATVGGIDFGFRNPFAAIWGTLDADGVLWIVGEHYQRGQTLYEHVHHLPANITWYADPAGAHEIDILRKLGRRVRAGRNELRAGIAAVHARLETGRLRVVAGASPQLLAEAALYRYPTQTDGERTSEIPIDAHNHALAALRYLVSRLDSDCFRRFAHQEPAEPSSVSSGVTSLFDRDELWQPLG